MSIVYYLEIICVKIDTYVTEEYYLSLFNVLIACYKRCKDNATEITLKEVFSMLMDLSE